MPQKIFQVPGVGEVLLAKRRGARHLRLSVSATGQVKVSLPAWTPYAAGVAFAKSRSDWIQQQLAKHPTVVFKEGDLIGKSHRLHYHPRPSNKTTTTRVNPTSLQVFSPLPLEDSSLQKKINQAAERALRQEAQTLLPNRLRQIADKNGFEYKAVKIKKLTSRWGSCNHQNEISLSHYLMQLPWHYIDYVLVHELVHTEHLNHGKGFWDRFVQILPDAKRIQKEIRNYKPHPMPSLE